MTDHQYCSPLASPQYEAQHEKDLREASLPPTAPSALDV
jgi:hypothetical protein